MTISDKIRIYELSRDLNLDNKDILDAAQKLSISVKNHSSSISAEEAKKIKNLINKKNSDKKILSIKKPSIKKDNYKQNKEDKSSVISSMKGKPLKDNSNKKPLLIKPLNKPESQKIISNKPTILNKPTNTNSSQSRANLTNKNINSKPSQNLNQDKKTFANNTTPPIKSPAKPPIQLIAKPKNINNNVKSNESSQNISSAGDKRRLSNKPDQNTNKPTTKIFNNRMKTPELVGAPIRREDPKINPDKQNNNKQNIAFKQTVSNRPGSPNRPGMPNRPGLRNKPSDQGRPGSFNRQGNPNRPGSPNRPGMPNRPGLRNKPSDQGRPGSFNRQGNPNRPDSPNRPGMPNRPGSKFNSQNSSGIRKPVSPNELLQLQKNN